MIFNTQQENSTEEWKDLMIMRKRTKLDLKRNGALGQLTQAPPRTSVDTPCRHTDTLQRL